MKLKHLAAFLMLLAAIGCTQQPASQTSTPADSGDAVADSSETSTDAVEPATETQLASTTVSFDVTGMR